MRREPVSKFGGTVWPAVSVLAMYLVFLAGIGQRYQWNPSAFIGLGSQQVSNWSDDLPPGLIVFEGDGYDGQYFYQVALDLVRHTNSGTSPMRYQRIVYPLVVGITALGNERWIPAAMIVVNLAAATVGTWFFGLLLRAFRAGPASGLLYGLNPGLVLGIHMDLAFPLQMMLATAALLSWEKKHTVPAAVLIALSLLTSESTLLFLLPLLLGEALARRWRSCVILCLSVVPFLVFQIGLLSLFGNPGIQVSAEHIVWPFAGMMPVLQEMSGVTSVASWIREGAVLFVMGIMFAALAISLWKLSRRYDVYTGGVLSHAGFSMFAARAIWEAYASAGRVFSGLFIFLPLSYASRRERAMAALLVAGAALGVFTLLRPFVITPLLPYTLTR